LIQKEISEEVKETNILNEMKKEEYVIHVMNTRNEKNTLIIKLDFIKEMVLVKNAKTNFIKNTEIKEEEKKTKNIRKRKES
jgi:hypothetical protein